MDTPETLVARLKRESNGFMSLEPALVEREKREEIGYMIALVKRLGRPLSENELRELGNIR